MKPRVKQFSFVDHGQGPAASLPYLPIELTLTNRTQLVEALVDSGSAVNVLPYDVGLQLGAIWEQQTIPVQLTGNLAREEARALVVSAKIAEFASVKLAFAWSKLNTIPVILGQVNFFMEFDVCFFRSRGVFRIFEIEPKKER